jgi:hypothetical protein
MTIGKVVESTHPPTHILLKAEVRLVSKKKKKKRKKSKKENKQSRDKNQCLLA